MIRSIYRSLFYSVPSLKSLSEAEKAAKLKELQENFNKSFNKAHIQEVRNKFSSFSPESLEKMTLILEHLLQMNNFEIIHLRKAVQSSQESEYNWPIFERPNSNSNRFPTDIKFPYLGTIKSSHDLVEKLLHGRSDEKVVVQAVEKEEVQEKVVETEKVVEKSTYNLVMTGYDPANKVKFIKAIKDALGLGLKESKDKVEEVAKGPVLLFKAVSKESHGKICETLTAAGGKIEFQ